MAFFNFSIRRSSKIYFITNSNFLYNFPIMGHRRHFSYITIPSKYIYCAGHLNRLIHLTTGIFKSEAQKNSLTFDSGTMSQFPVSNEIHFYRDSRNHFTQMSFSDLKEPYGPPLVILLPWKILDENLLKKFIELYGEKGFDILTVNLTAEQMLYPCVAGGAMNIVTELLEYLDETHKHRPYIFHGFSIGAYIYGEIMAQFSDQYEKFHVILNNVKGCLWDSPVDVLTTKPYIGKAFYPNNWLKRWRCNQAVRKHFREHYHDSVVYWLRSRENFCNPVVKVPNIFFVSCCDILSNPNSLQCIQKTLEYNGIPIFQKSWWDSAHTCHFEKYCYEYLYGMILFFNMSNLYPDESGKYYSGSTTSSLNNVRLKKKAKEEICQLKIKKQ